jgi:hypothetical protein
MALHLVVRIFGEDGLFVQFIVVMPPSLPAMAEVDEAGTF